MNDLWHFAQDSWQALIPEAQVALRAVGVLVVTFLAARAAGWMVGRRLRAVHFDAAFRRPWTPPPAGGRADPHALTPTRLLTGLVRLTVWGGGLWALAHLSGWADVTHQLQWAAGRVWAVVGVVLAALVVSRRFTEKLMEAVQASPLKQTFEAWPAPAGGREGRFGGPATAVGLVADVVVIVFALLVAADLAGLTVAGEGLRAAWHLFLRMFTAGIALLIGWLGARWVRGHAVADAGPASSPAGFGAYAAAIVSAAAAVLAILLLAGDLPTYIGLILLALAGLLVWPARQWLPDIYAGVLLRMQQIKEVRLDGETYPVGVVGPVQTHVTYPDGVRAVRNRVVLDAHLAHPSAPSSPDEKRP